MRKVVFGDLPAYVAGGADGNGGGAGLVVVLLHGFGAPGTDLLPLADEIDVQSSVRFVFPMAPLVLDPFAPEDHAPRAWWHIDIAALQLAIASGQHRALVQQEPPGLTQARERLQGLLDAVEQTLSVAPEQVVVGGFSQGAMLATDCVLRGECRRAGLVILSGTLLAESIWMRRAKAHAGMRVLQSHGRSDPILPFSVAEQLQARLASAGLSVRWLPFAGGHGIPAPVLDELGLLLRELAAEAT